MLHGVDVTPCMQGNRADLQRSTQTAPYAKGYNSHGVEVWLRSGRHAGHTKDCLHGVQTTWKPTLHSSIFFR